jgi:Transposase and inactivated derivatives
MKYEFIEREKANYPIARLIDVLQVSRSSFYDWRNREPSQRERDNETLLERIRVIHAESHGTYGWRRVHAELKAEGWTVNRKRVARLMRLEGLQGTHRRSPRRKPVGTRHNRYEDHVQRNFTTTQPNVVWVGDVTQHPTDEGLLYLAVVIDTFQRKVIGWSMADHESTDLVLESLDMAWKNTNRPIGVIHHSDQGSVYTSIRFGAHLVERGLVGSMGRTGTPADNAVMESFFATLQTELLDTEDWRTRDELANAIFSFIEIRYNRKRRHSTLGYLSPVDYERSMQATQATPRPPSS